MTHDHAQARVSRLALLRTRRDTAARELRLTDLEIGATAAQLLDADSSQSLSSIARVLGVSHTHVKTLAQRAETATSNNADGQLEQIAWGPPIMGGRQAANHVRDAGSEIVRVVASFEASDILWMTGLPPSVFDQGSGQLWLPHMMWQLENGDWIGVDQVNVGYGGSGESHARHALERAGIETRLIEQIAAQRWSDTDIRTGDVNGDKQWPRVPLDAPTSFGDFNVLVFNEHDLEDAEERVDRSGFYDSTPEGNRFQWAIDYLDRAKYVHGEDLPPWVRGPRRARIFLDSNAAIEQGFADSRRRACAFVVEQGALQLWVFTYEPTEPHQLLADKAYEALSYAGLYPDELAKADARSKFWRYLDHRFGREHPPFIELSPDDVGLRHAPGAERPFVISESHHGAHDQIRRAMLKTR